jgi:hypothetical protein
MPERDEYLAQMLKRNSTPTEMLARTSNRAEKIAFFMELPMTVFISSRDPVGSHRPPINNEVFGSDRFVVHDGLLPSNAPSRSGTQAWRARLKLRLPRATFFSKIRLISATVSGWSIR